MVFPRRKSVIFVHGCFWHGHGCAKGQLPKSKGDYWGPKIRGNKKRDLAAEKVLIQLGWKVLIIWQCETKDSGRLARRLSKFLDGRE